MLRETIVSVCLLFSCTTGDALFELVNIVTEQYFSRFRCITFITDLPENNASSLTPGVQYYIVDVHAVEEKHRIMCSNTSWCGELDRALQNLFKSSYEEGCKGIIVQTKPETRLKIVQDMLRAYRTTVKYRYNNHRYLFLAPDDNDLSVLGNKEMFFMPNLLAVTREGDTFVLVTHTHFNAQKWDVERVYTEEVDTWTAEGGFAKHRDLYPDKIIDLQGKHFTLGVLDYPVFTVIEDHGGKQTYDGVEVRISAEFVRTVNGTWDGQDHPVELWGMFYENGSADGLLGAVHAHTADMAMAAVYQWYCDRVDCSLPYVFSEVTCMVPRPQPRPGWLTIIAPFTTDTWLALIISYVVSSSFVVFVTVVMNMTHGKKKKGPTVLFESFYNTFRLQLEQIPRVAYARSPLGMFYKWVTIYYFFVAVCWSGGIAAVLTIPRFERPINTAQDLLDLAPKMEWGATHIAWTNSIKHSADPVLKKIVEGFKVLDDATLTARTKTRDYGFFFERLNFGHYAFNNYINEESMKYLKMMEGTIYTSNTVVVQPRGSPYAEKFDLLVLRIFETGLIKIWETKVSLKLANNKVQNMIRRSTVHESAEFTNLQVRHIQGAIYILLLGLSAAILVFCCEVAAARFKDQRKSQGVLFVQARNKFRTKIM